MKRKGQVWVETVIYTLIGLALIGIVLAIMTPKINEFRDQSVIDQTIESLNVLDATIQEVQSAPGNKRIVEFNLKQGELYVDPVIDSIYYVLEDSRVLYSQPGETIAIGRIDVLTEEGSKRHKVTLTLQYNENITISGLDSGERKITPAGIPYRFSVENRGFSDIGVNQIDITEIS